MTDEPKLPDVMFEEADDGCGNVELIPVPARYRIDPKTFHADAVDMGTGDRTAAMAFAVSPRGGHYLVPLRDVTPNEPTIQDLIANSSIGRGLANIRENGIEAELEAIDIEERLLRRIFRPRTNSRQRTRASWRRKGRR